MVCFNQSLIEFPSSNLKFKAFQTTRYGGFSQSPYESFNLAHHVGDNVDLVLKNRLKLKELIGACEAVFMDQTHSKDVIEVQDEKKLLYKADGLFTQQRGLALAVMTADCLPLLLVDKTCQAIAAVHCGWRGLEKGIVKEACEKFKSHGFYNLKAFIGAYIAQESYEVDDPVYEKFKEDKEAQGCFTSKGGGKYQFNLGALCELYLKREGVEDLYMLNLDTFENQDLFYSYRRNKVTGRMACVIMLEKIV